MRNRAGAVLIEEERVVLIERHRAGAHYFVFPGGGVEAGETPEAAAVREMEEETGLRVVIRRKLAVIQHGRISLQHYFLVQKIGGEFGHGKGEEMSNLCPDDPTKGTYRPVWIPVTDLRGQENIHPAVLATLVVQALEAGWPREPQAFFEDVRPAQPPAARF